MTSLTDLFKNIKKSFTVSKVIEFGDFNIQFTLEPLTSMEELKVLEACNGRDGGAFISELKRSTLAYAIKKINDIEFTDDIIEYPDDKGKILKETKYVFMVKQIDALPAAFRDTLFEVFDNLQLEMESIVSSKAKFERFKINFVPEDIKPASDAGVPQGFRKIVEPDEPFEDTMDETDRLNQQVKKEAEQVQLGMASAEYQAEKDSV